MQVLWKYGNEAINNTSKAQKKRRRKTRRRKNKWVSIYKDKFKAITVSDHRYFSQ